MISRYHIKLTVVARGQQIKLVRIHPYAQAEPDWRGTWVHIYPDLVGLSQERQLQTDTAFNTQTVLVKCAVHIPGHCEGHQWTVYIIT